MPNRCCCAARKTTWPLRAWPRARATYGTPALIDRVDESSCSRVVKVRLGPDASYSQPPARSSYATPLSLLETTSPRIDTSSTPNSSQVGGMREIRSALVSSAIDGGPSAAVSAATGAGSAIAPESEATRRGTYATALTSAFHHSRCAAAASSALLILHFHV